MSSTHRHLLLDFFWQVISGPPCIFSAEFMGTKIAIYYTSDLFAVKARV
jgi:hypothetical protein